MLEILPCPSTGARCPIVGITAVYNLLGAVGLGGERGEGYGVEYLGRFGDGLVG